MSNFCETFELDSLIEEPTFYKNPEKPTCIDLILTSKQGSTIALKRVSLYTHALINLGVSHVKGKN